MMKLVLKNLLIFGAGLLLLFFLFRGVNPTEVFRILKSSDWRFFIIAFFCYLGVNWCRAERYFVLLERKVGRAGLFPIIFSQNFMNVVMPFAGDVSYLFLTKKNKTVSAGASVLSLAAARGLDVMAVSSLFILIILSALGPAGQVRVFVLFPLFLFFLVALILFFLMIRAPAILGLVRGLAAVLGVEGRSSIGKILFFFDEMVQGFARLREKRVLGVLLASSYGNWLLTFLAGYFLLTGLNIPFGFWRLLFVYGFPVIASLSPFSVFGGFGVYEGSVVFGLMFFGVPKEISVPAALALHVQELFFVIIPAAGAIIWRTLAGGDKAL